MDYREIWKNNLFSKIMDFLQYYMSMKFKSCCDFFELFLRNFSVSVTLLSQVMGGVWKYLSNCLILSQELSSLLLIIDGPKYNEFSHWRICGKSWSQSVYQLYFRENSVCGQSVSRISPVAKFIVFRIVYYFYLMLLKLFNVG